MKMSNMNLNNLLNNRKMIKRSSTLIRDNILKIKNSSANDININHYSILQQKHFFKKRKMSSDNKNSNKNENIFLINENDNSREDSQDDNEIYIELMKLIFEGKTNSFINFYKKNKKFIDVNQDLFDGNTLLILSAKDGNSFISKFLCEQGAKINTQNLKGNTALHYAIGKQFYGVADILARHGAREDIRNNMGLTPWECIDHNMEE
jgi:ankyrin repeat protein